MTSGASMPSLSLAFTTGGAVLPGLTPQPRSITVQARQRQPSAGASQTPFAGNGMAAALGVSALAVCRALKTTRGAERQLGGVAVLEKPQAKAPAKKAQKKARKDEKPKAKELEIPLGATTYWDERGRKALFAGGLVGAQGEFSAANYNFDPLGFSNNFAFALPWFREAELKHGRVAMLAFVGLIAPDAFTVPYLDFLAPTCSKAGGGEEIRVIDAYDACSRDSMPLLSVSPVMLILTAAGVIEIVTTLQKVIFWKGLTLENAGDFPMREEVGAFLKQLPTGKRKDIDMYVLKVQELKHCRLAMLAFSGAYVQGALSAHSFPWWW